MADYTDIPDTAVGVGGIPSGTTVTALRDNPIAIAERATGAPRVVTDYEPLASIVASTDATIDFTVFDATKYVGYVIHLANVVPSSDGANLLFRTSADGGSSYDSGATDYAWVSLELAVGAPDTSTGGSTGDTSVQITSGVGSGSSQDGITGQILIMGPDLTTRTNITWQVTWQDATGGGSLLRTGSGGGQRRSAAAVDAVRLLFSAGTVESGEIHLFGIRGV